MNIEKTSEQALAIAAPAGTPLKIGGASIIPMSVENWFGLNITGDHDENSSRATFSLWMRLHEAIALRDLINDMIREDELARALGVGIAEKGATP